MFVRYSIYTSHYFFYFQMTQNLCGSIGLKHMGLSFYMGLSKCLLADNDIQYIYVAWVDSW